MIDFRDGSSYTHSVNGDSIPTAIYNSGSTVQVVGISNAAAFDRWGAAVFGSFVWDCTDQSSNFLIGRNLTMASLNVIDTPHNCYGA